jgi:hypothetical protein
MNGARRNMDCQTTKAGRLLAKRDILACAAIAYSDVEKSREQEFLERLCEAALDFARAYHE